MFRRFLRFGKGDGGGEGMEVEDEEKEVRGFGLFARTEFLEDEREVRKKWGWKRGAEGNAKDYMFV